jgi:hypothetical protein
MARDQRGRSAQMKNSQVSTLAVVSWPARKNTPSWSMSSSRVKGSPGVASRASMTALAISL